ncbi:MAG: nickel pincer cofactor biosynthesis protein LarC [Candidatus Bathyarchaeota archaeon]|nr:nickel pincer cofactor biosynthesis protein LarC [Candidatus Bathyarchaeota archaeon]
MKMIENNKILLIDCQASGVAGDMILGALIDLGANIDKVVYSIKSLEKPEYGYSNIQIKTGKVMRGEFQATQIDTTSETANKRHGNQLIDIVEKTASTLNLTDKARQFASKTIRTLGGVEANLHKTSFADAHLHEVALVDTAAEILGVAVAADDLGLFDAKIYATPLAVGGGIIKFSHGIVSVPAPATLAILQSKNFPFHGGPIEAELATPTGVAILVNLVDEVTPFYPSLVPLRVGYGTGTKEFEQMPTVLRFILGNPVAKEIFEDEIAVLETNIDDATGEIIGYTIDKLLSEGAKDVSVIPMFTKKNRPGHIIKVIAEQKDAQRLSQVLINETGTLGVRVHFCQRHIIAREVCSVDLLLMGNLETVRVKISKDQKGRIIRIKPEYEDLKKLAEKTRTPLRELMELATENAKKNL